VQTLLVREPRDLMTGQPPKLANWSATGR
jgi:hypothetical protein